MAPSLRCSAGSGLLALVALACLAAPALGNYCPRYQCPDDRVDSLDRLTTDTPLVVITDQDVDTPAECKAACPCETKYYAILKNGIPAKWACYCYAACNNGTFTGIGGTGTPAISHGYICSRTCNDPHFVGAHGTHYDFNGELDKSFCLVTDKSVHVNALFKGYKTEDTKGATVLADGKGLRSWMGELGVMWTDSAAKKHSLRLVARSGKEAARGQGFLASVSLDGAAVAIPQAPGGVIQVADMALTFVGTFLNTWGAEEDKFILTVGNKMEMLLHVGAAMPAYQLPSDALVHLSFSLQKMAPTAAVHGVLGQTYRTTAVQLLKAVKYSALSQLLREPIKADGASGMGFLDGKVSDYVSSSVLAADCAMTAFN